MLDKYCGCSLLMNCGPKEILRFIVMGIITEGSYSLSGKIKVGEHSKSMYGCIKDVGTEIFK